MFTDLAGQVAVVTGGARGLGLSMARALAGHGVELALFDLLPEVTDSAASAAADHGVRTTGSVVDVRSPESVADGFARAAAELGTPTLLVNAAGITIWGDTLDLTPQVWQQVIDVNLTGTFLCCQALARGCRDAGRGGAIVNISSMSGQVVNVPQRQASYHASKAGVDMLTKALAVEWAPLDIRVNAIGPGYFLSDMTRKYTDDNPELAAQWRSMIPAGRMGEPSDLDGLVAFLLADASRYLIGQTVIIDGAYTAI